MTDIDAALRDGLRTLEETQWSAKARHGATRRGGRRLLVTMVAGVALVAVAGASLAVGAIRLGDSGVRSAPGVFSEGQPLHCSGLDEMTLADADRFVRARGFTVFWQIENPAGEAVMSAVPPATGSIAGGVLTDHGTIVIVIDPSGERYGAAPRC